MSVFSAIENQNRILRLSQKSSPTIANSSSVYVTIPGWPSSSTLKRLWITGTNLFSQITVNVLTDGASYRKAGSQPGSSQYIQKVIVDPSQNVFSTSLDMSNIYIQDTGGATYLYLNITSQTPFTTGTIFNITAEGTRLLSDNVNMMKRDDSFKILFVSKNDNINYPSRDITSSLSGNGNPYGLGSPDTDESYSILNKSSDYLYIGSMSPIQTLNFNIPTQSDLVAEILVLEVWNGTAWVPTPFLDNTSDGQGDGSFASSGTISIPAPATWIPTQVQTDPMKIYVDQVNAGTAYPIGFCSGSPARYWVRLSIPTLATPLQINSISSI